MPSRRRARTTKPSPGTNRRRQGSEQGDVHGRVGRSLGLSLHQVGYCLSQRDSTKKGQPWWPARDTTERMPWKAKQCDGKRSCGLSSSMEREEQTMTELCQSFGIARETGMSGHARRFRSAGRLSRGLRYRLRTRHTRFSRAIPKLWQSSVMVCSSRSYSKTNRSFSSITLLAFHGMRSLYSRRPPRLGLFVLSVCERQ